MPDNTPQTPPPPPLQTVCSGPLGVNRYQEAALTETREGEFILAETPEKAREIAAWFIRYAEWLEAGGDE